MRIGIIASARHAIREPFAGGLEMHTHALATSLKKRGHSVTVFASATSDPELGLEPVCEQHRNVHFSEGALSDASALAKGFLEEHHAYLNLMLRLNQFDFDVIHNNCLHYLPVAMAEFVKSPIVTSLHTPPTPWLESALTSGPRSADSIFVAVSEHTAQSWSHSVNVHRVILNGVDLDGWTFRHEQGSDIAVWFGRIRPEKGPHLALEAAHLVGKPLVLAGPIDDRRYFVNEILPRLNEDDSYVGHIDHAQLDALVGSAAVSLSTPCWDEPFGLVVPESFACGTPVAAFQRGAMPELVDESVGALAEKQTSESLAIAVEKAARCARSECRRKAELLFSLPVMVDHYEDVYKELAA